MTKAQAKKICIVVSSLGNGGAEKASALLSKVISSQGFEVHLVSILNIIDYSYEGTLFNLGLMKDKSDSVLSKLKRLIAFRRYLKHHKFHYIIDNRTHIGILKQIVTFKWIYRKQNVICCIHSYNTNNYINSNPFVARLLYNNINTFVSVSEEIARKIRHKYSFDNVITVYNTIDDYASEHNTSSFSDEKYILFFGRINDEIKNLSLLLDAYAASSMTANDVGLKILGSGKDKFKIQNKVESMGLSKSVEFLDFNPRPSSIIKNAYFTILTSRYEGFPMVILESLALETPVVSVDCKSGPNEIIVNEHNGLIVENHNVEALANAMDRMLEDKDLYLHCKSNAKHSVKKFSKDIIGQQWKTLLK